MSTPALFDAPVLRVSQPIGEFWLASIPADVLLQCTVADRLRVVLDPDYEGSDEWKQAVTLLGNQRELHKKRIREIGNYIDSFESTFPNSIIISAENQLSSADDESDNQTGWKLTRDGENVRLVIPYGARKATIVDGQHRLYGFLHSKIAKRQSFELVCAVFFDLPKPVQAMIFATINTNQKPVRRGMALNLYGYNVEDEPRNQWTPEKLAVFIARRLNFDPTSQLYNRIKIEAEGAPEAEGLPGNPQPLSLAAVVDGILGLVSSQPKHDRDALRTERKLFPATRKELDRKDPSPLRGWFLASADAQIYELVKAFVEVVASRVWARSLGTKSMLTRAVGIRALFQFLRAALLKQAPHLDVSAQLALQEVDTALVRAANVDFSDPWFEATGRGQRRILIALQSLAGWGLAGATPEDSENVARILRTETGAPEGGARNM